MGGKERWIAITVEEKEWEKKKLEEQLAVVERELEKMPKETLIFRKDNFGYRYYAQSCENGRKTRIYLTDPEDIKRLFRKKLLQAWAKDYRADLRATNSYLD